MKTLVCLISKQHIPNLLTVKTIRPDNLVLLVTAGMKKNTDWFLRALSAGGLDYSEKKKIINVQKENSVEETLRVLKAAHSERPGDEWIINVTGGTKPMSIGAYMFAQENRLKALYIVESDQQNAIDLSGGEPLALTSQHVTDAEFLEGYGYEIRNTSDLDRLNQRASALQDLGALLTKHHGDRYIQDFLGSIQGLKEASGKKWERKGLILNEENQLWVNHDAIRQRICASFHLKETGRALTGHLEKPAVEFLTGKWLEYFVFGLLKPLEPTSVRCLQAGLTTGKPGPGQSNEFDVSFMTERSLCMVECKTGSQRHDPKGDAVIYKMEAIKAGLGALRVSVFLATTAPNIIDPLTGDTREALTNRSKIYSCAIINGVTLNELASLYLAHDPSLNARVEDVFMPKNPTAS